MNTPHPIANIKDPRSEAWANTALASRVTPSWATPSPLPRRRPLSFLRRLLTWVRFLG